MALHNCIFIDDTEHVYLKFQFNHFKNKEVLANHKPHTQEKLVFRKILNSKPLTLNSKFTLNPKP